MAKVSWIYNNILNNRSIIITVLLKSIIELDIIRSLVQYELSFIWKLRRWRYSTCRNLINVLFFSIFGGKRIPDTAKPNKELLQMLPVLLMLLLLFKLNKPFLIVLLIFKFSKAFDFIQFPICSQK